MRRVVTEQSLGFVATVCPDGTPNLSPKGTTAVFDDDHLVFAHIHSPRTVANLASNPAIEINVVDPIVRKGYRFKGTANVVTDGELYGRLTDFFAQDRNLDAARVEAVVLVRVDRAEPLISPTYDAGRPRRRSRRSGSSACRPGSAAPELSTRSRCVCETPPLCPLPPRCPTTPRSASPGWSTGAIRTAAARASTPATSPVN